MENHDPLDEKLRALVQCVERVVPPDLEARARAAADARRPRPKSHSPFYKRPIFLVPLSSAAIAFLALWVFIPRAHGRAEIPITEIRTEFELSGKNITIIFVQRPDFPAQETVN
jgi:hypothetical protein